MEGITKTSIIFIGDIRPFVTDHLYAVPAFPTADADSTIPNSVWWLPIFKSYRHKKTRDGLTCPFFFIVT